MATAQGRGSWGRGSWGRGSQPQPRGPGQVPRQRLAERCIQMQNQLPSCLKLFTYPLSLFFFFFDVDHFLSLY